MKFKNNKMKSANIPPKRFTWYEMKKYWEIQSSCLANKIDYKADPDGLGSVCHPGAPLWLNSYYAHIQKKVYERLFSLIPKPKTNAQALDMGCGTGRWCRFLASHGYNTTGIDIQPEMIEMNIRRYLNIEFICTSIQEYNPDKHFDVISSVTVLQHIPFEEQEKLIQKIRKMLKVNSYAIVMENIHDQGPHVFSNTIHEWRTKFETVGFRTMAIQRYDYSPFIRFYNSLAHKITPVSIRFSSRRTKILSPEDLVDSYANESSVPRQEVSQWLKLHQAILKVCVRVDSVVEPLLVHSNIPFPTVHCGFLFKAV